MNDHRVGFGYDAHRFEGPGPIVVCGVTVESPRGVAATSDGDVAAHALADAVLGAASVGDLGMFFPSSDPQWQGANSLDILQNCAAMVFDRGFDIVHADVTVVAESVRIAPHRDEMREEVARVMRIPLQHVSVKATTTDGMGWIGAEEGLAAYAVVTVKR